MKVARAKLREIGPDDVDMEEYRVREESDSGSSFLTICHVCV